MAVRGTLFGSKFTENQKKRRRLAPGEGQFPRGFFFKVKVKLIEVYIEAK